MRGLLGFRAQTMDGRRPKVTPYATNYPQGSYTWTCPETGYYRFVQWGAGGGGDQGGEPTTAGGGAPGAHTQTVVLVRYGQKVAVTVGAPGSPGAPGGTGGATTVTLPNGRVVTAGGGPGGGVGGVAAATRGDININGGGVFTTPPSFGDFRGGGAPGQATGGGAPNGGTFAPFGQPGAAIIARER